MGTIFSFIFIILSAICIVSFMGLIGLAYGVYAIDLGIIDATVEDVFLQWSWSAAIFIDTNIMPPIVATSPAVLVFGVSLVLSLWLSKIVQVLVKH